MGITFTNKRAGFDETGVQIIYQGKLRPQENIVHHGAADG